MRKPLFKVPIFIETNRVDAKRNYVETVEVWHDVRRKQAPRVRNGCDCGNRRGRVSTLSTSSEVGPIVLLVIAVVLACLLVLVGVHAAARDLAMHRLGIGTTRDMKSVVTGIFFVSLTNRASSLTEKLNMRRGKSQSGISRCARASGLSLSRDTRLHLFVPGGEGLLCRPGRTGEGVLHL